MILTNFRTPFGATKLYQGNCKNLSKLAQTNNSYWLCKN